MTEVAWLYAVGVILLAYTLRGISGFGSGLISVPLLALVFPLGQVVPLILLLDFTASLVMGGLELRRVKWREIWPLVPMGVVGVMLGTSLLVSLPLEPLLIALAVFVFVFALRSLLGLQGQQQISRWWALPASLTGGTVGALFGTGGPPYVIYLAHRLADKTDLRATFSGLFLFEGLFRLGSFGTAGLLSDQRVWLAYAIGLPLALTALYLGGRIHTGLSARRMGQVIGALLLLSSLTLLTKALL
jgi:uncharacterized membrane protein YfcA